MIKVKLEYVWLDGYQPEPNLRSKVKIMDLPNSWVFDDIPNWGFDGSSTKQAEGHSSDCILVPVRVYRNINPGLNMPIIYVLCDVYDKNNKPHETNERAKLGREDNEFWVGFEQEYFIRSGYNKPILSLHETNGAIIEPQGKYYCGVGGQIYGREVSDEHLTFCLNYGINIEGTNAEVAIGQWEYQIFAKGKLKACDDLWMSRYFLFKLAERRNYHIELHPKPLVGWNGSGLHTNFSNQKMREEGGEKYFDALFRTFESRADVHINAYGSDNNLRLTGGFETQSIDKFTWGVSDRGASIRVPKSVGETWKGYLEDRRPASNANPYKVVKVICDSLDLTETLFVTLHNMMYDGKIPSVEELKKDPLFGKSFLSNEELLKEYMINEPEEINQESKS